MDELKTVREPEATKEELQKRIAELEQELQNRIAELEQELMAVRQNNQSLAETVIRLTMKYVGVLQ